MKSLTELGILGAAILLSVLLYRSHQMMTIDPLDELKEGLSVLRPALTAGSKIGCVVKMPDASATNCRIPNALAPATVLMNHADLDSTLFVSDGEGPDPIAGMDTSTASEIRHWRSPHFRYAFTVKR